jgi:two-component system phosphate regulon sensor histidine kinase PhoR
MKTVDLIPSQMRPASWPSPWADGLGEEVLLQNAMWFIHIRWAVVVALAAFGLLCWWCPSCLGDLSLVPPTQWPWQLAAVLAMLNGVYLLLIRSLRVRSSHRTVETCMWWQIGGDLLILTMLVHHVGSIDTFVAFAYLFHIVLACIFFAPGKSFLVTALSAALFLGCLALEITGVAPTQGILSAAGPQGHRPVLAALHGLSAVFIWLVVWYLASSISKAVRDRDRKLAEANERLTRADQEKNQIVLRTTHDLKAPFTGIESSIAVLRMRDWASLPDSVRAVVESIEVRSATLRERIKDILTLGELRQAEAGTELSETVDLDALLHAVAQELAARAAQRNVTVRLSVPHLPVQSSRRQLLALFSNLVANAIVYSHEGGSVEVEAENGPDGITVRVADHGIGISEKALPRIFEEYFRTDEAVRFNKLSTGLGLAIVKEVAESLRLRIRVTSEQGKGTSFLVRFPREGSVRSGSNNDH